MPSEAQKDGLVEDLEIDADGCVRAVTGPGLGVEIDFDLIRRRTVEVRR